jgi:hypothetical protein
MTFNRYKYTLKHDNGKIAFIICATDLANATSLICKVENCPERAILKIENLGNINKINIFNYFK